MLPPAAVVLKSVLSLRATAAVGTRPSQALLRMSSASAAAAVALRAHSSSSSAALPLADPSLLCRASLINGQYADQGEGSSIIVRNPSTGAVVQEVLNAGKFDTEYAVASADGAFPAWAGKTARQRSVILRKWYDLLMEHKQDLAVIMTSEQGKPLTEALGEVQYSADYVQWFAEEAPRAYGMTWPGPATDRRGMSILQPIGVCAAITPWNFPMAMLARKAAAALAAGCTVVAKPSELTPLSALALAELALRAGVPPGAFNVVVGDAGPIGAVLTGNRTVRKLSFTGSTAVGKLLLQQCAATVKRTSMELGGNAPFLVFDDADVDAAVDGLLACKFRNAGQTCVSANRVLVQAGIHDAFVERLAARVAALEVGDGMQPGAQVGPLVNEAAVAKVERHVADAIARGAGVAAGGARHALGGLFYQPTVLTGCSTEMRCAHEETFGPVAAVYKFGGEAEALALANAADAGLAGYVFSESASRLMRVGEALECGMVGLNTGIVSSDAMPFGGVKESGHGREGSRFGMDEYLEMKAFAWGVKAAA